MDCMKLEPWFSVNKFSWPWHLFGPFSFPGCQKKKGDCLCFSMCSKVPPSLSRYTPLNLESFKFFAGYLRVVFGGVLVFRFLSHVHIVSYIFLWNRVFPSHENIEVINLS